MFIVHVFVHVKPNYQKWRDTVDDMMAEPRRAIKYHNIFPDENSWG
jgi:hypothetical protein